MNTTEEPDGCIENTIQYIKLRKAAEWIDASTDTVRRLIIDGEVEGVKVGMHWRINVKSLRDYLKRHGYKKGELEASS